MESLQDARNNQADSIGSSTSEDAKSKSAPFLPPCRVCSNPASGFHYGVNTCEACKGFFRRSISRKTAYPACSRGGACPVQLENRNACMDCRLRKCHAVGMSKSAIKTGRYTHQKRTMDTLEVKTGQPYTPTEEPVSKLSSLHDSTHIPTIQTTSSGAVSIDSTSAQDSNTAPGPSPKDKFSKRTIQLCDWLQTAFRQYFPDTTYLYEHLHEMESIIAQVLKEFGMEKVDTVLTIEGDINNWQVKQRRQITEQVEIVKSFEQLNSSLSGDAYETHYQSANKGLFESWSVNLDRFVHNAVQFAKKIPGFLSLPIDDQVTLIKYGRSEIASIVKFKHFNAKYESFIDYHTDTKTMYVFPNEILRKFLLPTNSEEAQNHTWVFQRCMLQLSKLDMTLADISLLCALTICSPDRIQLTSKGKESLTVIHSQLVEALEYCLSRTHRGQESILAKCLMVLPTLREIQVLNNRALSEAQERFNPELTPLLKEILPKPSKEDCQVPENHHLDSYNSLSTTSHPCATSQSIITSSSEAVSQSEMASQPHITNHLPINNHSH